MSKICCLLLFCAFCVLPLPALADDEGDAERKAAVAFVTTVREAVSAGNKEAVAKLVSYPLEVDGAGSVKDSAAFLKRYDAIVTAAVKKCVSEHNAGEDIFQRNGQYMIGWGCFWFSPDEGNRMGIDAVNTKEAQ